MKRTISLIIPAYNEEAYRGACLESLKDQSFRDFELIVVDSNATDTTARVARFYIDIVLSCPQQGISAARNFGAAHASGDILCFIDADGIVSRHWVRHISTAFSGQKEIDAVCGFNLFRQTVLPKAVLYNLYNVIVFLSLLVSNHIGRPFVAGNNMPITKGLFLRVGGFPEFVGEA
ncbi:MAG: glycosyltransferase family 2 protein [Deltaproteobacteria bacterium]|nr:glycosyltransferase family 2 protein [Candidatus Zymogenaceae bacterium]